MSFNLNETRLHLLMRIVLFAALAALIVQLYPPVNRHFKYSYEIIGDPNASVGVITNGFHELRALSIAKRTGFNNAYSVPAVTLYPVGIHYVVREFFGMMEYYIKGIEFH